METQLAGTLAESLGLDLGEPVVLGKGVNVPATPAHSGGEVVRKTGGVDNSDPDAALG